MGFMDIFYPNPKQQLKPKYRKSCNCDECVTRNHSYGELWRNKTPSCSCCDCMSKAGLNIPHNFSTYGHTHAAVHSCAETGTYCGPTAASGCRDVAHVEPPPKYSLMPHTTHKVDEFCDSKHYTTPLALVKPHVASDCYRMSHGSPCSSSSTLVHSHAHAHAHGHSHGHGHGCACKATAHAPHGYREDMYLAMPSSYVPCNR
ncbi:hypothetical protein H4R99_004794 [Coemansia sp. RSA 1722]|nr:hypothetical protein LPJ57_006269 [Coemansia sp. RSA 486]KAJ2225568.1 hypothetical protein IWW45_007816 [Coemansia sp. RSA 485]KAJ2596751.1 hypothetical protein H4R99_004794 [Coemansia sp. RSA 1722]